MTILKKQHISALTGWLLSLTALCGITSCSEMSESLPECASGAELRFIYDYNMEYANSFMHSVDCLTVYIYDENGRYITTRTESSKVLSDENWRMKLDLPAGNYHIVSYGGMQCDKASFSHPSGAPAIGDHYSSIRTALNVEGLAENPSAPLHDHFWGTLDMTVRGGKLDYDQGTVYMRKNTNNIRVVLQHLNGDPVDPDKFHFRIVDDNTLMGHDNELIHAGKITYHSWAKGTTSMGMLNDGRELLNAYAQLSVSRLVESDDQPRLIVTTHTGREVMNIDLVWLIRQARQQNDINDMDLQEYLDRESRWAFIFLLDENNNYVNLRIKVNDWVVRFNHIGA